MRYDAAPLTADARYPALNRERYADETLQVERLLAALTLSDGEQRAILDQARGWVRTLRGQPRRAGRFDAFLTEYRLDSRAGLALLSLAEALLRVPDRITQDALIRDKLGGTDWRHPGASGASLFVEASTWALVLTGRLLDWREDASTDLPAALRRGLARVGEPLIRAALQRAMGMLGEQFVMGRTIAEALTRAAQGAAARDRYSFDRLGEAACTAADARCYAVRYLDAIAAVSGASGGRGPIAGPGVSIKLSR